MKPKLRFRRLSGMVMTFTMVVTTMAFSGPSRLDFYDKSNNHLLYVDFVYDAAGALIGRTVYAADGTFLRDVVMNKGADGKRTSEVSKNFNTPANQFGGGDTLFVTNYTYTGTTTSFTIHDQFRLDHVGGAVNYTPAPTNPLLYDLVYQNDNSLAASVLYEIDAVTGSLVKVNVYDKNRSLEYIGIFSDAGTGTRRKMGSLAAQPQAKISSRGQVGIDVQLNLAKAGQVKCELLTLSGRVAGVLLDEMVAKGNFLRSFRSGSQIRAANGVYLFVVSVNGTVVSSSRYLNQAVKGGLR